MIVRCLNFRPEFMQKPQRRKTPGDESGNHPPSGFRPPVALKNGTASSPTAASTILAKLLAPGVLTACLWTRSWFGMTEVVLLTLGVCMLLLFGPQIFSKAANRVTWARLAGYGERIWLNRLLIPVPQDLNHRLTILYIVFWLGALVAIWGAFAKLPILSVSGLVVAYSAQAVCLGKLIRLYAIMRERHPLYRFWSVLPVNDNRPTRSGSSRSA